MIINLGIHTKIGSVDFLVKCCLYRLLKIIKLMLILGKVRLSKVKLFHTGLGKGLG